MVTTDIAGSSSRRERWRNRLRSWSVILLSTCLALLAVEAGLRIWRPDNLRLFPRFHEAVSYGPYRLRRTRPDTQFVHSSKDGAWTFAINHQGFRDDHDYSFDRPAGMRRVLILGDSQAMGYENLRENAFPARLSGELDRRALRSEVINSSVAGFGTAEEMVFLEQEGLRYRPDAVVLLFYRNDYSDNVRSGLFRLGSNGQLVEGGRTYIPGTRILAIINSMPPLRWLSQHSYTYSLAFNAVWNGFKNATIRASYDPNEHVVTRGAVPPSQKRLAEALVLRIAGKLAAQAIPLVIVDVPEAPLDHQVTNFRPAMEEDMMDRLRASGVTILSSEAAFARYRGQRDFRRPHGERHVTPFVHAMMARGATELLAPMVTKGRR